MTNYNDNIDAGVTLPDHEDQGLVSVRMFDRVYEIKSDQPELVTMLADDINREAARLRELNPALGPGRFDWPVQVAFQMALMRYKLQRAYTSLAGKVEGDAEKMASLIDEAMNNFSSDSETK